MNIKESIEVVCNDLKATKTQLVVVSKTHPISTVLEAYNAGHRIFGENRVQELVEKYEGMPRDIQWHLIGHLQKNKVKYIANFISLIHSVDSLELLKEINKQAEKSGRIIECLLQVYIAQEETKFGLDFTELNELVFNAHIETLPCVKVVGLMAMATNTTDKVLIASEFEKIKVIFEDLKKSNLPRNVEMRELSIGMSSDYKIATHYGSTMVRVGSLIFGNR